MKILAALGIATAILSQPTLAQGVSLTVEGLRNGKGNVLVFVFDHPRAFDNLYVESAIDYAEIPARKGTVAHHFKSLNAGPYAIFVLHDENKDQDLNYSGNAFLEGIGASGAPNPEDNPGFADAAFTPGPVKVRVHYDK